MLRADEIGNEVLVRCRGDPLLLLRNVYRWKIRREARPVVRGGVYSDAKISTSALALCPSFATTRVSTRS